MYLTAFSISVIFVIVLQVAFVNSLRQQRQIQRRQRFIEAVKCAFIKPDDFLVGRSREGNEPAENHHYHRVFLFSISRGFLKKTDTDEGRSIGYNLLSQPTIHQLSCNSNNKCSIYLDSSEEQEDGRTIYRKSLAITSGRVYYSIFSNVFIRFIPHRQLLVFFDKTTRRYVYSAYPVSLERIRLC